ncbi:hypothetical protein KM043_002771 [Ampulex compressa]|nr:hypothetical protein KM043_002771 [Ampulex compressa]
MTKPVGRLSRTEGRLFVGEPLKRHEGMESGYALLLPRWLVGGRKENSGPRRGGAARLDPVMKNGAEGWLVDAERGGQAERGKGAHIRVRALRAAYGGARVAWVLFEMRTLSKAASEKRPDGRRRERHLAEGAERERSG